MTEEIRPQNLIETVAEANPELATSPGQPRQNWIKVGVDYGPIICFGLGFFAGKVLLKKDDPEPLIYASAALAAASILAVIVGLIAEKRIAWIPLVAAIIGIPFAVLTVVFHDAIFVKIKMTVVDVLFGVVLLGGLVLKKQPLKTLFGEALKLRDEAWPKLTLVWGIFYLVMAAANEVVWRTQNDTTYAIWKLSAMIGGPIALMIALFPFVRKYMILPDADDPKAG